MMFLVSCLWFLVLQDVDRLVTDLRSDRAEIREAASTKLARRLTRGGGDRAVYRILKRVRSEERDQEVLARLKALLGPWQKGGTVWERNLGVPIDSIVEADGSSDRLVVIKRLGVTRGAYPCRLQLVALSPRTGEPLWEASELIGRNPAKGRVRGDRFICTNGLSELMAFDLKSGKKLWSAKSRRSFSEAVFDGDRVYLGGFGWVTAFDAATGRELWVFKGNGWMVAPIVAGERLVTGGFRGGIVCLSKEDGKALWKSKTRANPKARVGDRVICTSGGGVVSVGLSDGKATWSWKPAEGEQVGTVVVQGDRVAVQTSRVKIPENPFKSSMDHFDFRVRLLEAPTGKALAGISLGDRGKSLELAGGLMRVGTKVYRASDGEQTDAPFPKRPDGRPAAGGLAFEHDPPKLGDVTKGTVLRAVRLRDLDEEER